MRSDRAFISDRSLLGALDGCGVSTSDASAKRLGPALSGGEGGLFVEGRQFVSSAGRTDEEALQVGDADARGFIAFR